MSYENDDGDDGEEDPPTPREHVDPLANLGRAAQRVGGDFFKAWRRSMSGADDKTTARSLVEMTILTIRGGDASVPDYLSLPAHLPDGEKEQRVLSLSAVKLDQDLKSDLFGWAHTNRHRQVRAAKALENLVHAYRGAEFITADPDCEDAELVAWLAEMNGHAHHHFGVDVGQAPQERGEIESWSWRVAGERNPSPSWLTVGDQPAAAGVFDPSSRAGGHARAAGDDRD